jgi:hypothetical protein
MKVRPWRAALAVAMRAGRFSLRTETQGRRCRGGALAHVCNGGWDGDAVVVKVTACMGLID